MSQPSDWECRTESSGPSQTELWSEESSASTLKSISRSRRETAARESSPESYGPRRQGERRGRESSKSPRRRPETSHGRQTTSRDAPSVAQSAITLPQPDESSSLGSQFSAPRRKGRISGPALERPPQSVLEYLPSSRSRPPVNQPTVADSFRQESGTNTPISSPLRLQQSDSARRTHESPKSESVRTASTLASEVVSYHGEPSRPPRQSSLPPVSSRLLGCFSSQRSRQHSESPPPRTRIQLPSTSNVPLASENVLAPSVSKSLQYLLSEGLSSRVEARFISVLQKAPTSPSEQYLEKRLSGVSPRIYRRWTIKYLAEEAGRELKSPPKPATDAVALLEKTNFETELSIQNFCGRINSIPGYDRIPLGFYKHRDKAHHCYLHLADDLLPRDPPQSGKLGAPNITWLRQQTRKGPLSPVLKAKKSYPMSNGNNTKAVLKGMISPSCLTPQDSLTPAVELNFRRLRDDGLPGYVHQIGQLCVSETLAPESAVPTDFIVAVTPERWLIAIWNPYGADPRELVNQDDNHGKLNQYDPDGYDQDKYGLQVSREILDGGKEYGKRLKQVESRRTRGALPGFGKSLCTAVYLASLDRFCWSFDGLPGRLPISEDLFITIPTEVSLRFTSYPLPPGWEVRRPKEAVGVRSAGAVF